MRPMIKSLFSSVDESDAVEVHPIGSSSISFSIHFFRKPDFFCHGKIGQWIDWIGQSKSVDEQRFNLNPKSNLFPGQKFLSGFIKIFSNPVFFPFALILVFRKCSNKPHRPGAKFGRWLFKARSYSDKSLRPLWLCFV